MMVAIQISEWCAIQHMAQRLSCRIPDDHMAVYETVGDESDTTASWPAWFFALQRGLRQLVVVQGRIAHQRLTQILGAVETVSLQDIRNAAIEAFDHAIGSGGSGLGETVLEGLSEFLCAKRLHKVAAR